MILAIKKSQYRPMSENNISPSPENKKHNVKIPNLKKLGKPSIKIQYFGILHGNENTNFCSYFLC